MNLFKKKAALFATMLAFLTLTSTSVQAVTSADVLGKTSNMDVVDTSNTRTDINLTSKTGGAVGQVDWRQFNVGANEHVNFGFNGISQTIINRVLGGQASNILGKMTSSCMGGGNCTTPAETGKVIMINPAGVMFGAGSMVDLNSFTVSTFDFNGAQNIKGMSNAELENYQNGTLNKLSPLASVNGTGKNRADITFDRNYNEAFDKAGISRDKGSVTLDGTTFDHFYDIEHTGKNNTNKSSAIVSDNIQYKDSLLRTGLSFNYASGNDDNYNQSFSNVKLITADGATFTYLANGYVEKHKVAEDASSDVARNITMDNANLGNTPAIESGNVYIESNSNKTGDVKIKDSVIKADKLVNVENGDIAIVSSRNVDIDHSRIETVNTSVSKDGKELGNTLEQNGGTILVRGQKDVNVKDSLLISAGKKGGNAKETSGDIYVLSDKSNINMNGTRVLADGDATINAAGKVTMDNSIAVAENSLDASHENDVTIYGSEGVDMHNSAAQAKRGNVDIKSIKYDAEGNKVTSGNINITSDLDADGKNQTVIYAGKKLTIQGKNTKLDNA